VVRVLVQQPQQFRHQLFLILERLPLSKETLDMPLAVHLTVQLELLEFLLVAVVVFRPVVEDL
jgi:hypothetical protein